MHKTFSDWQVVNSHLGGFFGTKYKVQPLGGIISYGL